LRAQHKEWDAELVENRGTETGAWRGKVHGGQRTR